MQGQAHKAVYTSELAKIELEKARGKLIERELIDNYINQAVSMHNDRLLNLPEQLSELCLAISKTESTDAEKLIELKKKWKEEISTILSSEINELHGFLKKKH